MRQILSVSIAALFILAATMGAHAGSDDRNAIADTPHITMYGSASTEVVPDLATIVFDVTRSAPTAKAAVDALAPRVRALVDAAKAAGVKDVDIKTNALFLERTFEDQRDPQGRLISHRPTGYAAFDNIEIRTRDMSGAVHWRKA